MAPFEHRVRPASHSARNRRRWCGARYGAIGARRNLARETAVVEHVEKLWSPSPFDTPNWWDGDGFLLGLHTLLDPVRVPYFTSVLARRIAGGALVLDVGCGGGFVAKAMSAAGHDVVGVDSSHAAIRAAQDTNAGHFTVGQGERLPFRTDCFDAAICSEVLEHVSSPDQVLAEIARTLKPGGTLMFSTPNRSWASRFVLIDLAQKWRLTRILPPGLHEWDRMLKPRELRAMMALRGLGIDELRGLTISLLDVPRAALAVVGLKRGRLGYEQAGRQIRLRAGGSTAIAYLGTATYLG